MPSLRMSSLSNASNAVKKMTFGTLSWVPYAGMMVFFICDLKSMDRLHRCRLQKNLTQINFCCNIIRYGAY